MNTPDLHADYQNNNLNANEKVPDCQIIERHNQRGDCLHQFRVPLATAHQNRWGTHPFRPTLTRGVIAL